MAELMHVLGFDRYQVAAHDRGARVLHHLSLDYPDRVRSTCSMHIVSTATTFALTVQALATAYCHWLLLIQAALLPENMISAHPHSWLRGCLHRWSGGNDSAWSMLLSLLNTFAAFLKRTPYGCLAMSTVRWSQ